MHICEKMTRACTPHAGHDHCPSIEIRGFLYFLFPYLVTASFLLDERSVECLPVGRREKPNFLSALHTETLLIALEIKHVRLAVWAKLPLQIKIWCQRHTRRTPRLLVVEKRTVKIDYRMNEPLSNDLKNGIKIILLHHFISFLKTAASTAVKNNVFPCFRFHPDWFHKLPAGRFAVTGIHINVFAPETLRTVVGVTASLHKKTALLTREIFFRSLEFFCHDGDY